MEEAAAKQRFLSDFNVPRETVERVERFIQFLREESARQNLVARQSLDHTWSRHILDSAQLLRFSPGISATWLDLGTGAGFPGLIVALLHEGPVTLVEERRKRIEFLRQAVELLGLERRVAIHGGRAERLDSGPFDAISARAFAPLDRLLEISHSFSTTKTRFILPKGRNAASELEAVRASWQGDFRLEPSLTDGDAWIIVAEGVRRRAGGGGVR